MNKCQATSGSNTGADGAEAAEGPGFDTGADGAEAAEGPGFDTGADGAAAAEGPGFDTGADGAEAAEGPGFDTGADGAEAAEGPGFDTGAVGADRRCSWRIRSADSLGWMMLRGLVVWSMLDCPQIKMEISDCGLWSFKCLQNVERFLFWKKLIKQTLRCSKPAKCETLLIVVLEIP